MRIFSSRIFLSWPSIMFVLVLGPGLSGQVADFPTFEHQPPAIPVYTVWIEGEQFISKSKSKSKSQSGWEIRESADCYGGKTAVLNTSKKGDYRADYSFSVDRSGLYLVSVAGQPVGRGYTSPITISFDGGAWQEVKNIPCSKIAWGPAGAVNWTNLALAELKAGTHTFSIRVNMPRTDGVTAYMVDAIALVLDPYRTLNIPPDLATDKPGNVFTRKEKTVFRLKQKGDFGSINWSVADWQGTEAAKGVWDSNQNALVLPELDLGFYRLKVKGDKGWEITIPFSRVVDPETRIYNPDNPFAVDSAQSWHAVTPGNRFAPADPQHYLADLLRLAGITMVRDRFNWGEGVPGKYDWSFNAPIIKVLSEHGVRVCGIYHYVPEWTREGRDTEGLPHDLIALYKFCRESGRRYPNEVAAWEFWNEEDVSMTSWYFAAAMKAAYLGYKAGNPQHRVLNGASCLHPVPRFMDIFMESGMKDYFDVYNCHVYSLQDTPATVKDEQEFLVRFGAGDKPIWITENGLLQGGGREPLDPGTQFYEHTEPQELDQAEYLIKAQIRFVSYGVARDFSFIFVPYNECGRGRVWGMLRWDYLAKPAYTAFANLTAQLSNARYLGAKNPNKNVKGFVFEQTDGKKTYVLWSDISGNTPIRVRDSAATLEMVDFMGKGTLLHPKDGLFTLSAGRYPVYVRGFQDIKPTEPFIAAKIAKPSESEKDLTIVLRLNLEKGFKIIRNKALVDVSNQGRAVLDIFNLSETAKQGRLENLGQDYTIRGLPESISLPPMGRVSLVVDFKFKEEGYGLVKVRLGGKFNGKPVSPVYVPIKRPRAGMDPSLKVKSLPMENVARWGKNSSGAMEILNDVKEKAVRFKVKFPPAVDQWIYPEFRLRLPIESMNGAVGVGFEVKASQAEGWALVMACLEDQHERGESCWLPYLPTTEWQTVNILFEEDAPVNFNPAYIKMLRIGVNPGERAYEYRIRNFKVYYKNLP
jgi:hypothetical protein